jgi:drug/metabolite transporter (DMT)-like permease
MLLGSFSFAWMGTTAYGLRLSCDWQIIALARAGLALVFALFLAGLGGVRLVLFRPPILWVRSIAGSISLVCTFYALTRLPQSHVLTITSTFPIWVALLSWPLYQEKPGVQVWLSVASSVLGVVLIEHPAGLAKDPSELLAGNLAVFCAITASFATAVAMLGLHQLHYLHPWSIVAHFSGVAVLFCVASFALGGNEPDLHHLPSSNAFLWLLVLGVTATIGQLFLTKAFTAGPPAKVSVVGLTQVVFAMVLDVWLWGRSFSPTTLGGMALILAPTAWLMAGRDNHPPIEAETIDRRGQP